MSKIYAGYCQICGKYFESSYKSVVTCSRVCAYKLRGTVQRKRITRVCVVCHKDFEICPAWLRKGGLRGSYCSRKCRWANKINYTKKDKKDAVNRLHKAIRNGEITPKPCYMCGISPAEAHHHKGYDKENWLNIVWLCSTHHNQEHELLRKMGLTQYL